MKKVIMRVGLLKTLNSLPVFKAVKSNTFVKKGKRTVSMGWNMNLNK